MKLLLNIITGFSVVLLCSFSFAANNGYDWTDKLLDFPYRKPPIDEPVMQVVRADFSIPKVNESVRGHRLEINSRKFDRGVGVWAESYIRLYCSEPIIGFNSFIGIDTGPGHTKGRGNVYFIIKTKDRELFKSDNITGRDEVKKINLHFEPVNTLELIVINAGENPAMNQADWAMAQITLKSGKNVYLDQVKFADIPYLPSQYPFSFIYDGKPSDIFLKECQKRTTVKKNRDFESRNTQWLASDGLKVSLETRRFERFPAVEWLLWFENTSDKPTSIIENVQSMDIVLNEAIDGARKIGPYKTAVQDYYTLHKTKGDWGTHNPMHFMAELSELNYQTDLKMSAMSGRPSKDTLPFFKIDTKVGALITAIGWSGQWNCFINSPDGQHLRIRAGLEDCHFRLLPGEKVRLARILALKWNGDTWDANAKFRKLIYEHYTAKLNNAAPLPGVWANTWAIGRTPLNDSTAEGHMEMIEQYARLPKVKWFITDAGWYKGGFGTGEGDYIPNPENWPNGVEPAAAAASRHNIGYGLWFDVEKVYGGTDFAYEHPNWLLARDKGVLTAEELKPFAAYLRNLGKPEVVDNLCNMVGGYLQIQGMKAYRQDFNYDPLSNWRANDKPDRKGITEIKYIMGLYDFWQRLADRYPDVLRDQCSSGGRRIDLETVRHMHVHQKCDLSGHPEADQSSIWGLSQYLPNNVFSTIQKSTDDYGYFSAAPASMALGWKVYRKNFDFQKAKNLINIHDRIKHLLIDSWYPLTRPNINNQLWIACQYHRTDLDMGLVTAYRRDKSPYRAIDVNLREIKTNAMYDLEYIVSGKNERLNGSRLMNNYSIQIEDKPGVEFIIYKAANSPD